MKVWEEDWRVQEDSEGTACVHYPEVKNSDGGYIAYNPRKTHYTDYEVSAKRIALMALAPRMARAILASSNEVELSAIKAELEKL